MLVQCIYPLLVKTSKTLMSLNVFFLEGLQPQKNFNYILIFHETFVPDNGENYS